MRVGAASSQTRRLFRNTEREFVKREFQWGRVFSDAETVFFGFLKGEVSKFQWGRVFSDAETERGFDGVGNTLLGFNGAASSQTRRLKEDYFL